MSPLRGIPTSRAYWELKAEQVLNRVFEPEQPILVEVRDTPVLSEDASVSEPEPAAEQTPHHVRRGERRRKRSSKDPVQRWGNPGLRQPTLLLAGVSISVMLLAAMALLLLGVWAQFQQATRQERNMLLMERLRSMGPSSGAAPSNQGQHSATNQSIIASEDLPPPPGEPWMEELASLPPSSAPATSVLRVPISERIGSSAPAASASDGRSSGSSHEHNTPQLVGVVQVPGQNGSAIFQIGGSSTSAAVGESIGNSGWRLRSASGDSAVIEKGGTQRRVSISSGM